jgi:hypothetical protein
MAGQRISNIRKTRPVYFIFCEGETEYAYINLLRSHFRFPIEIRSKVLGTSINRTKILRMLDGNIDWNKDKVFLIYDSDIESINTKLGQIEFAFSIFSYPCFEAWLLLHFEISIKSDSCDDITSQIRTYYPAYKKGEISLRMGALLIENMTFAITNAKKLVPRRKGSHLFDFIESLVSDSKI